MKYRYYLILVVVSFCAPLTAQDLDAHFRRHGLKGSITLFDYRDKKWISSDDQDTHTGTLPASTFKVLHSLIALQEKAIGGIDDTIRWDGIPKKFKTFEIAAWNKDTDLEAAFKNSTVWFYTTLAERIKKRKYKQYLRRSGYGNGNLRRGRDGDFWNFGAFRVTPHQQVNLLISLYEETLPFDKSHQKTVKSLMIESDQEGYVLRSKTGWSYDGQDIGWYIGYVELEDNVIFFATRIQKELSAPNPDFSKSRKSITKKILADTYHLKWNP